MRDRWQKNDILAVASNHLVDYPTSINTSYMYGFGSLAGLMLVVQILTGVFF
jgi:ubiquinol-cytochrome c reductase cytochrome b subunit